jgi:hypothetical protein
MNAQSHCEVKMARHRFDEHVRAFAMSVVGVAAVVIIFVVAATTHSTDGSIFVGAITAVTTLAASAAGHAAGAAKAVRETPDDRAA